MKLSTVKGETNIDIVADLLEPIANIAQDDKYKNFFPIKPVKDESPNVTVVKYLLKNLPSLLRDHRHDAAVILSIFGGSTVEDMTLVNVIKGFKELATDKDFLELFTSVAQSGEQTPPTVTSEK